MQINDNEYAQSAYVSRKTNFFARQHLVSYCFIYRTKINHYFYAATQQNTLDLYLNSHYY